MGKKPVVGLIGLFWVGIALTGCGESCRNCRNKYEAKPMFGSKSTPTNTTNPTMNADARGGTPGTPASAGAATGVTPAGSVVPAGGMPVTGPGSANATMSGTGIPAAPQPPTPVSALRPAEGTQGRTVSSAGFATSDANDYGAGAPGRNADTGRGFSIPAPPTSTPMSRAPSTPDAAASGGTPLPSMNNSTMPPAPPVPGSGLPSRGGPDLP